MTRFTKDHPGTHGRLNFAKGFGDNGPGGLWATVAVSRGYDTCFGKGACDGLCGL